MLEDRKEWVELKRTEVFGSYFEIANADVDYYRSFRIQSMRSVAFDLNHSVGTTRNPVSDKFVVSVSCFELFGRVTLAGSRV